MTDHSTRLGHCSGCTDPRSEGTHQMGTIEHPEEVRKPLLGDDEIERISIARQDVGVPTGRAVRKFYEDMIDRGELDVMMGLRDAPSCGRCGPE